MEVINISQFENNETAYTYIKGAIYRKWEREMRRIERGNHHYEQMLKRYDEECGECMVINPAKDV